MSAKNVRILGPVFTPTLTYVTLINVHSSMGSVSNGILYVDLNDPESIDVHRCSKSLSTAP